MAAHDSPNPVPTPRLYGGGLSLEAHRSALAAPAPPALATTPDAMSLFKALRRRWFLALSLGVLLAGVAVTAAYFLLPARFTAFTQLLVSSKKGGPFDRPENNIDFTTLMNTVVERIKGRQVLLRAVSQDSVRHLRLIRKHPDTLSALTWLDENLKVEHSRGSELITVSLSGEDPNDLTILVNALVASYLKIFEDEDKKQRKQHVDKIKVLYEDSKTKLSEKVALKDNVLKSGGATDNQTIRQRQDMLQAQLISAQNMLTQQEFELEKKRTVQAHLEAKKKTAETSPTAMISLRDLMESDSQIKLMQANVTRYENTVNLLRSSFHPESDITLRTNVAMLNKSRRQLEERLVQVRAELMDRVHKKTVQDLDTHITNSSAEVKPLENHVKIWKDKVEKLEKDVAAVRYTNARHDLLDAEVEQEKKNFEKLGQVFKEAQAAEEAEPRIASLGEAELQNRDTKKRLFLLALTPLAALLGTVLAIAWWEFMARRINGPDEVASSLALRVVGEVPELPDPRKRRLGADPQAEEIYRHNLIESIDAIRTMLLRNADAEHLRVVMVTSAVSGEGKTTLASNLAMSLARAGRKTLLMDCDLRRPAAHQLFEQTLQPGFSEAVLQEVELPDAVRPTTTDPNLFLLPAGHWDREVIQELAKAGLTGLFEKLRHEYEFIVVDSHPVLPATDSLLLGQHADAVIVSLMRDVSQTHLVQAACQQLAGLGIRVFGAVVNGVPVKVYGKHYQYTQQPTAAA